VKVGSRALHVQVKWMFDELTPYSVTGDPTKATAEKGRQMREAPCVRTQLKARLARALKMGRIREMPVSFWDVKFSHGFSADYSAILAFHMEHVTYYNLGDLFARAYFNYKF